MAAKKSEFEMYMNLLEEMAAKMDSNEITIDEMMATYEQALKTAKKCRAILDSYESKVDELMSAKDQRRTEISGNSENNNQP